MPRLQAAFSGGGISAELSGRGALGAALSPAGTLEGRLGTAAGIAAALSAPAELRAELHAAESSTDAEIYKGDYVYTPTEKAQTVRISHMLASRDIVINPIPSNYGRITWNGSTLTVS